MAEKNFEWPGFATKIIKDSIECNIAEKGCCSIALTGGGAAGRLYNYWAENKPWDHEHISYFWGDERCVPPTHQESNYGMFMRTLFHNIVSAGVKTFRMEGDAENIEAAARAYEQLLPASLDILLLGLGLDGHIASLFPQSSALKERSRLVLHVQGPKAPGNRLTITPPVIKNAREVYLLATGAEKGDVLARALAQKDDVEAMPVRLILGAKWLLDEEAAEKVV